VEQEKQRRHDQGESEPDRSLGNRPEEADGDGKADVERADRNPQLLEASWMARYEPARELPAAVEAE
jgi:hypothetical protein